MALTPPPILLTNDTHIYTHTDMHIPKYVTEHSRARILHYLSKIYKVFTFVSAIKSITFNLITGKMAKV